MAQITLLILAILLANLPWLSSRLFLLIPVAQPKRFYWSMLELAVYFVVMGLLAWYAEFATLGQTSPQGWEFYTINACLFLVFSFPGFIYRNFWLPQAR